MHVITITYVRALLQKYKRVDLVCDVYLEKSLKAVLRDIRSQGERKKSAASYKDAKEFSVLPTK